MRRRPKPLTELAEAKKAIRVMKRAGGTIRFAKEISRIRTAKKAHAVKQHQKELLTLKRVSVAGRTSWPMYQP